MEVNNSSGRIKKFSGRPGTISLREFKANLSTVVYELDSSMVLITRRHSHSNNWLIMCTMKH
jgi:hypothetical protein